MTIKQHIRFTSCGDMDMRATGPVLLVIME